MKLLLLVMALVASAGPAQAQALPRAGDRAHRLALGMDGTTRSFIRQPAPVSGASASYSYVLDRLAIAATAAVSVWYPSSSIDSPYTGRRFDLGLSPRVAVFRANRGRAALAPELYLLAMGGATWSSVTVPERRAIREKVDGKLGWYVGAGAGGALVWTRWGIFLEVAYQLHRTGLTKTVTALDGSQAPVVEHTHPAEHQLVGTAGVLLVL